MNRVSRVFATGLVGIGLAVMAATPSAQRLSWPPVGRSLVATELGIVAASQPLAARAGVQVLEHGGNAVDAAIAANATIGLMEPTGNGMGGDLFALVYEAKTGRVYGLNASGWAATRPHAGADPVEGRGATRRPPPNSRSASPRCRSAACSA